MDPTLRDLMSVGEASEECPHFGALLCRLASRLDAASTLYVQSRLPDACAGVDVVKLSSVLREVDRMLTIRSELCRLAVAIQRFKLVHVVLRLL